MAKKPLYTGPASLTLRRHPHGNKTEITNTVRWVAFVALFLFSVLAITFFLTGIYSNALVSTVGLIPILIAINMLKQDEVSLPSTLLAITIILLITWLATL